MHFDILKFLLETRMATIPSKLASLKDAIAKKDEEIGRLGRLKTNVHDDRSGRSSPRYGPASPRRHSIEAPQQRRTLSRGKHLRLIEKAASDLDNSSEYSDKKSEAGYQQSMDDFRHHKEFLRQSRFAVVDGGQNFTENIESRRTIVDGSQSCTEDVELLGFGVADSEERLSDISDGGLSMGTETEGSLSSIVEFTLFPETAKTTSREHTEAQHANQTSEAPTSADANQIVSVVINQDLLESSIEYVKQPSSLG